MSGSELPRPELVSGQDPPRGYQRKYRILGPPGACLVQRVEVRIRFLRDAVCVVEYRGEYGEYFLLGDEPEEERLDVHDFDLGRDGWGPSAVRRLLRRHRLQDLKGAAQLEVTKTFTLGRGSVEETRPCLTTSGGGAFGFLAELDGVPNRTEVVLRDGRVAPAAGEGPGWIGEPAGRGTSLAPAWRAEERFRYRLATQTGHLETDGYVACSPDL